MIINLHIPNKSQISINLIEDASMIDYKVLKQLVIEAFEANPYKPVREVIPDVEKLAAYHGIFPSHDDCVQHNFDYKNYRKKRLSSLDKQHVNHIIWQLIRDSLIVITKEQLN